MQWWWVLPFLILLTIVWDSTTAKIVIVRASYVFTHLCLTLPAMVVYSFYCHFIHDMFCDNIQYEAWLVLKANVAALIALEPI